MAAKTWANGDVAGAADLTRWETAPAALSRQTHALGLGLYFPEAEGALANGSTDDHAAIAAAFAAAPVGSQVVLAQGKTYAAGSRITVPTGRQFNGSGSTLKWIGSTDRPLSIDSATDVIISDLTVDCGGTPPGSAIVVTGSDRVKLQRFNITSTATTNNVGIKLTNCTNSDIDHCTVQGTSNAYNINGASRYCKITHSHATGAAAGVMIAPSGTDAPADIDVEHVTVTDFPNVVLSYPIRAAGTSAAHLQRIRFDHCTVIGPGHGFNDTTNHGTADQINAVWTDGYTVTGCTSMYGGDMGFSFSNCTNVTLTGNLAQYNCTGGITASSGCSVVTITGNTAVNNGQNFNGDTSAIGRFGIGSAAANIVTIVGNTVSDNQTTPTQNYGVRLQIGGDTVTISGNTYKGNAIARFYSDGTPTNVNNVDASGGADVFGGRVAYNAVNAAAAATIAAASTWTAFTGAPTITLPNDGGTYEIELHGKAVTMNPASTLTLGLSGDGGTSMLKISQHVHSNVNAVDRAHLVAGNVTGSGQTITVWALALAAGTATVTADASGGNCALWATRIG